MHAAPAPLNDPGAQAVHVLAPGDDDDPAAHGRHAPTAPVAVVYVPLAHGSQSGAPALGADEYPGAHAAHERLASVDVAGTGAVPSGQGTHEEEEL